ncbi:MAG: hypothetical protein RIC03_12260 [Cyclobacteriaceae bacterium]
MDTLMHKIGISIILFLTVAVPLMAQNPPPATPIDGGLSLLLIAGGAYGVKKLYSKRK